MHSAKTKEQRQQESYRALLDQRERSRIEAETAREDADVAEGTRLTLIDRISMLRQPWDDESKETILEALLYLLERVPQP
jgi:hypothetical protein